MGYLIRALSMRSTYPAIVLMSINNEDFFMDPGPKTLDLRRRSITSAAASSTPFPRTAQGCFDC